MTKEEIIYDVVASLSYSGFLSDRITDVEARNKITLAMDEFAQQEAIAFAKFYHNHVMETGQPPFTKRENINDLYREYLKQKK